MLAVFLEVMRMLEKSLAYSETEPSVFRTMDFLERAMSYCLQGLMIHPFLRASVGSTLLATGEALETVATESMSLVGK